MMATKGKGPQSDYPEERSDWLMVKEYTRQKSIFGCILCDKTHRKEECEHKAKRTAPSGSTYSTGEQPSWYD